MQHHASCLLWRKYLYCLVTRMYSNKEIVLTPKWLLSPFGSLLDMSISPVLSAMLDRFEYMIKLMCAKDFTDCRKQCPVGKCYGPVIVYALSLANTNKTVLSIFLLQGPMVIHTRDVYSNPTRNYQIKKGMFDLITRVIGDRKVNS